jgi:glutamate-ammonia-ligase adenylyltransferase
MSHALTFMRDAALDRLPAPADRDRLAAAWERWNRNAAEVGDPELGQLMAATGEDRVSRALLDAIFGNSPYLTGLALRDPRVVTQVATIGPDATFAQVMSALNEESAENGESRPAIMARLRRVKRHVALVAGLADVAGWWNLERVTGALSDLAAGALSQALRHLLRGAAALGQIRLANPRDPECDSGVIVLGMGKLGARELNYSSDIDLIILFDADRIHYAGRDSVESLMARLARDLVKLMEERTVEGYVFRTDLRLRPDPASTPPAVSLAAAETYYGSLGQNWERAALIKARPVAGDIAAGQRFLDFLVPFIWRKNLDFAAIRDIHSIKRQIDARHGGQRPNLAGYNVKLGHGGIREIEFFAQTQQLIWGGRVPALRSRMTLATLAGLEAEGRIEPGVAADLAEAYQFYRQVEHRLQMIDDSQTHSLPNDQAALARLAVFLGFDSVDDFTAAMTTRVALVRRHFGDLFGEAPALSEHGNLVFTGTESDPETLETLRRMGFRDPEPVAAAIRGWHHARIRATRSARAREILTEFTPALLKALAATDDPDSVFHRFDSFLSRLPTGVQVFSLLQHNPELLGFLAELLGGAPSLGERLAQRPILLDAVLANGFFAPSAEDGATAAAGLADDLETALARARNFEDVLDLTRRWTHDRHFQLGVQLLRGHLDGERAGRDFTLVAEAVIRAMLPRVEAEFARVHGRIEGAEFLVLGLGKLGSREMNALSDLDLIFLYRVPAEIDTSDGAKSLAPSHYFARLAQRFINALAAPTSEGSLYEVDMRLRPSGNSGPIATSLDAFRRYHLEHAWTWERQALTRCRVIAGDSALAEDIETEIRAILTRPRDRAVLIRDVVEMRERIAKAHPRPQNWDSKHRRGTLVDIEFVVQSLVLRHAPNHPSLLVAGTAEMIRRLRAADLLSADDGRQLLEAHGFWHRIQQTLRVTLGKVEEAAVPGDPMARALARATGIADESARTRRMDRTAQRVLDLYRRLVEDVAANLKPQELS